MKTIYNEQLLPIDYTKTTEPSYKGSGNHSVIELEKMISQYKEILHQMKLREQKIVELTEIIVIDKPHFEYNQPLKYDTNVGVFYFKEIDDSGQVLISNNLDNDADDYNDWWVDAHKLVTLL